MCGLAGLLDSSHRIPANELALIAERMANAIRHRGPDDSGIWCDPTLGIALGSRRLSIIDLSEQGHQPMRSHDDRFMLAFNGEIYNFGEIRQRIEAIAGPVRWRGHSDTEVMLEAFSHWGVVAATKLLVGMFAFAVFDRQERIIFLGRDRFGEKPLYYGWTNQQFAFASEIKALRSIPGWCNPVDRRALALYLRHGFIPAPFSIHQAIYKLAPGTIISLPYDTLAARIGSHDCGTIAGVSPVPYWRMEDVVQSGRDRPWNGSPKDAEDELDRLLRESTKLQMVADVPVGAFLSGGVDSSSVVAAMQAVSGRPAKTFTIGFVERGYDEARFARNVARHLGSEHTELYVGYDDALDVIPNIPSLYDEPFSDSSQIPTLLVAKLARQSVTVSLSGDGGDEMFGGYYRHFLANRIETANRVLPQFLRKFLAGGLTAVSPAHWDSSFSYLSKVIPGLQGVSAAGDHIHKLARALLTNDSEGYYLALTSHWAGNDRVVLETSVPRLSILDRCQNIRPKNIAEAMMFLDTVSYLPDDILVKVDRAAMAVSLETRVPFLDHRIADFAWSLPAEMRAGTGQGKAILRRVLGRYLPDSLFERPKAGFAVPIDEWLRGPLRDWAESLLDEQSLKADGFLDPTPIRKCWHEHLSGLRNWQSPLWDVLMFQAWLEHQKS